MSRDIKTLIGEGKTFLGIEFGSTRIKAVLIDEDYNTAASGGFEWENRLQNGIWTYSLNDVWTGLRECFSEVAREVSDRYGIKLTTVGGIGVSAMMHGYLAFDGEGKQLAEFRTWRNTNTEGAALALTKRFEFNIPMRWSVAHLYQAILNGEEHVKDIAFITTLAGYVHWKLTGKKVIGIGDASGMFPVDKRGYVKKMTDEFNSTVTFKKFNWKLPEIMPEILFAGDCAGCLTEEGARLLDAEGNLKAGIPMCPPEGDAGTGMVATNSVARRTGNVSAGTSIFAMVVLEKELASLHEEIDMVTTPAGDPVAMVHCNNGTSDIDAWFRLFIETIELNGGKADKSLLYEKLFNLALNGDADCGGLLTFNYVSGEPVTGFDEGRPMFIRSQNSRFTLANMMRALLFSTMGTLKIGMDILTGQENVRLEALLGHGGLFKTPVVGQRLMAAAMNVPVAVMESAGEGGAWGIALLAAYMSQKSEGESLEDFLAGRVFAKYKSKSVEPVKEEVEGFNVFMKNFESGLVIERAAVKYLP